MASYGAIKRGLKVKAPIRGLPTFGRVTDKNNEDKTVYVAVDELIGEWVPADNVELLPPDPLDEIHPMLAQNIKDKKSLTLDGLLADPQWGLEEKFDGERAIFTYRDGKLRITSRVVGKDGLLGEHTGKLPQFEDLHVLRGATVIDLELVHPKGFQVGRQILGSDPAKARARQDQFGPIHAKAFDLLWYDGEDLRAKPYKERRLILLSWWAKNSGDVFGISPIYWEEDRKREFLDQLLTEKGREGAMMKWGLAPYTDTSVPGRRSPHVLKVKPFTEGDFVIIGYEMGKGKYNQDRYGAVRLGEWRPWESLTPKQRLEAVEIQKIERIAYYVATAPEQLREKYAFVEIGTASFGTGSDRDRWRDSADQCIGTMLEVKYQSRWPDTGRLRHPNVVRLRDDKSPYPEV